MNTEEALTRELMNHTECYMGQLGIKILDIFTGTWDSERLQGYITLLEIKGDIQGFFLFNIETSLAYSLVNHYILEAIQIDNIPYYADKVVAEIANIVVGHTLNNRDETNLFLGVPAVHFSSEIQLNPEVLLKQFQSATTEAGIFQCLFIRSDEYGKIVSRR